MSASGADGEAAGIPRLRPDLDFVPVTYRGRNSLLIRDPLEIITEPLLVQGEALNLLGLIDGRRSLRDIQLELMRQRNGLFVSAEDVSRLVEELDAAHVLESPLLQEKRARLIRDYTALEVRPASHVGRAYPSDRKALEDYLDGMLALGTEDDAGRPAGRPRALIAPHIDLEAGRRAYARAYGPLRGIPPPRTVLLLGTGHNLGQYFFSFTAKDFETPLGRVRSDRARVSLLREKCGRTAAPDDFGHRSEHSLEFQLIFLQRLFGSGFTLIPVLCGSFQEELPRVGRAAEIPVVRDVLEALRELLEFSGPEMLVVAGVDLSHVGPKFGHDLSAAAMLAETRRHDARLTEALCRLDAAVFWEEIRQAGDRFNVCGFSTLACLLEILPAGRLSGRLLDYEIWREEATKSAVSFASIAYHSADGEV